MDAQVRRKSSQIAPRLVQTIEGRDVTTGDAPHDPVHRQLRAWSPLRAEAGAAAPGRMAPATLDSARSDWSTLWVRENRAVAKVPPGSASSMAPGRDRHSASPPSDPVRGKGQHPRAEIHATPPPDGPTLSTAARSWHPYRRPRRSGEARVFGRRYRELDEPARQVGAVLESSDFHPGRSGRDHLRALALAADISPGRVEEVLELVELSTAAGRRVGTYSLGMRQRLGLAGACSVTPSCSCSTNQRTGSTPRAFTGCARSYAGSPTGAGRS